MPLMFIIGLGVFTIGPAEDDLGPVLDGDRHRLTVIRWSFLFTVTAKQHERHHHGQRRGSSLSPCYVLDNVFNFLPLGFEGHFDFLL